MRKVAISLLKKLDCEVDSAANGEEALSHFASGWDLIFMDCQMPVLNGLDATRRWRALEQGTVPPFHVPIVALTGETDEAEKARCLAAGMDDFVSKPLKIDILKAMLDKWVEPHQVEISIPHPPGNSSQPSAPMSDLLAEYQGFESLLRQLALTYINEWPQTTRELQAAINDSNAPVVFQLAHKLKGQTLTLRAEGLSVLVHNIEQQAKHGELSEVPALADELEKSIIWLRNMVTYIDTLNES